MLAGTQRVARRRRQDTREPAAQGDGRPEVVLTEAERKKLFDMAMELHELQRRANEVAAGIAPLNTRLTELSKEAASKSDLPADLKASVDTLQKDVAELAPKLAMPLFGGEAAGGR